MNATTEPTTERRRRFVALVGADRPLCSLCGPETLKRAVFSATWHQHRAVCARCAVNLNEAKH